MAWAVGFVRRHQPWLFASWFAFFSAHQVLWAIMRGGVGDDAEIYYRAAANWIAGLSPWDAFTVHSGDTYHFFAAPTTAVIFAPFTVLPEAIFVPAFVATQAASAVYIVRRLHLAWWWILFPPFAAGVVWGNPSILVAALLVMPNAVANAAAALIKAYAGAPLLGEGRWRAIGIALGFVAATFLVAPGLWVTFIAGSHGRITQELYEAGGGMSGARHPLLFILGGISVAILVIYDRRLAGYLGPLAIWPGAQMHWAAMALPIINPWLAVTLAIPISGVPVYAVAGMACWVLWRRIRSPGSTLTHHATEQDGSVQPVVLGQAGRIEGGP